MNAIGDNIKRLRIQAGLSQEQLADKILKTRSAVSQYESGTIIPRMGVIEDIAEVFGVDKVEIIGTTGTTVPRSLPDFPLSIEEYELITLYNKLDERDKKRLLSFARTMLD